MSRTNGRIQDRNGPSRVTPQDGGVRDSMPVRDRARPIQDRPRDIRDSRSPRDSIGPRDRGPMDRAPQDRVPRGPNAPRGPGVDGPLKIWKRLDQAGKAADLIPIGMKGINTRHLIPIGNTGLWRTPDDPVEPWDCERWPNSPYCQGAGGIFPYGGGGPMFRHVISANGCEICYSAIPILFMVQFAPMTICYRKSTPECDFNRPEYPPDLPPWHPDLPAGVNVLPLGAPWRGRAIAVRSLIGFDRWVYTGEVSWNGQPIIGQEFQQALIPGYVFSNAFSQNLYGLYTDRSAHDAAARPLDGYPLWDNGVTYTSTPNAVSLFEQPCVKWFTDVWRQKFGSAPSQSGSGWRLQQVGASYYTVPEFFRSTFYSNEGDYFNFVVGASRTTVIYSFFYGYYADYVTLVGNSGEHWGVIFLCDLPDPVPPPQPPIEDMNCCRQTNQGLKILLNELAVIKRAIGVPSLPASMPRSLVTSPEHPTGEEELSSVIEFQSWTAQQLLYLFGVFQTEVEIPNADPVAGSNKIRLPDVASAFNFLVGRQLESEQTIENLLPHLEELKKAVGVPSLPISLPSSLVQGSGMPDGEEELKSVIEVQDWTARQLLYLFGPFQTEIEVSDEESIRLDNVSSAFRAVVNRQLETDKLIEQFAEQLKKAIGVDQLPATLPDTLLTQLDDNGNPIDDGATTEISNLVDLQGYLLKQIDAVMGQWAIPLTIRDSDPLSQGNQEQKIIIPNMAEAIAEIMGIMVNLNNHAEVTFQLAVKTLLAAEAAHIEAISAGAWAESNADFLGYNSSDEITEVPIQFTHTKDGQENILERLHEFLEPSKYKLKIPRIAPKDDLQKSLYDLLQSAAIIRAVFWQAAETGEIDFPEKLKRWIRQGEPLVDGKPIPGEAPENDFDQWVQQTETGFGSAPGHSDPSNPYGRDLTRRPRIRNLGTEG